jgi:hypothetical protein
MREELSEAIEMAKLYGLVGNAAIIAGGNAIRNFYGSDVAGLLNATHLLQPEQERVLTATEVGMALGVSAMQANRILARAGLQAERRDHNGRIVWEMTDSGKRFGRLFDTAKAHSNGTPVTQLKWISSVVDALQSGES